MGVLGLLGLGKEFTTQKFGTHTQAMRMCVCMDAAGPVPHVRQQVFAARALVTARHTHECMYWFLGLGLQYQASPNSMHKAHSTKPF